MLARSEKSLCVTQDGQTERIKNKFLKKANRKADFAHSTVVNEKELWNMFAKTGDVEWYAMYRTMKEDETPYENRRKDRRNANSRPES